MKTKSIFSLGIFLITLGLLSSCYYDEILPNEGPDINEQVSFSEDIIPVFNTSCNITGCHNTGGINPDLSASRAYNELKNGGYIDTSNPANSELYLWMTGKKSLPMPPGGVNKNDSALILAWIKQGAENN